MGSGRDRLSPEGIYRYDMKPISVITSNLPKRPDVQDCTGSGT
jgi:hypothetical protein